MSSKELINVILVLMILVVFTYLLVALYNRFSGDGLFSINMLISVGATFLFITVVGVVMFVGARMLHKNLDN